MLDSLLSALGFVGDVIDTPGSWLRNALSGENPFKGTFDPEQRTSGRKMLEKLGIFGENADGLDAGDVWGFLTEALLDPTNLIGAGAMRQTAKAAKAARAANAESDMLRAAGAMPPEVAGLTKIVDETGAPRRMHHGTASDFAKFDPEKLDPGSLFGPGYYTTDSPHVADTYATGRAHHDAGIPSGANIRPSYLDIRNPLILDQNVPFGWDLANGVPDPIQRKIFLGRKGRIRHEADFARQQRRKLFEQNREYTHEDIKNLMEYGKKYSSVPIEMFKKRHDPPNALELSLFGNMTNDRMFREVGQEGIRQMGFDGITHRGGIRVGGAGEHNVAIAFSPDQVYLPMIAPEFVDVPSNRRKMAALLGYNTVMLPERFDDGP